MQKRTRLFALVIVLAIMVSIPGIVSAQGDEEYTLELWTFVNTHARWWEAMGEQYKEEVDPNFNLEVSEIAFSDMHDRLRVSLQSGGVGAPDIADVEQGAFGAFLRGADPGFVDLLPYLEEGNYLEDLVAARQALYSYDGHVYGIEHALTPVVMYYRADLWEEAGVDMADIVTWDDFIDAALQIKEANGSVALPVFNTLHEVLLRQRGGDYFDAEGNVTIDSELSIETMNWILEQIDAGAAAQTPGTGDEAADWAAFKEDQFNARVGADWFAGFFVDNVPELSGKWMAAPLPVWEEGGSQTSVWGGTGAMIVNTSEYVEQAWDFLKYAMISVEGNVLRFELTNLFPPYLPAMDDDRLHANQEYFSGQDLGAVFAEVAPGAPAQYQSPYRTLLNDLYTAALQDIIDRNRTPEEVFTDIADQIREEMEFDA